MSRRKQIRACVGVLSRRAQLSPAPTPTPTPTPISTPTNALTPSQTRIYFLVLIPLTRTRHSSLSLMPLTATRTLRSLALASLLAVALPLGAQSSKHTIAQYIGTSEPLELATAQKVDRIAWIAYDRGMRNVFTAAAPDFKAMRLTKFMADNGIDLTEVSLSADGSTAVFVRGGAANRQGWIADPGHDPDGGDRAIWAVRTAGGTPAIRVAEGQAPVISPDGRWVLYVKDNQIFRARTTKEAPPTRMDTGGIPFIKLWGNNGQPHWSPDGSKIAFVSMRENHSLIGLYDVKTRKVTYVSPSVDCDGSPTWSQDGKQIAFLRRPGTPFGLQAQQGNGGIGNP